MKMKTKYIQYETSCVETTQDKLEKLMDGAKKCSYNNLLRLIKRDEPNLFYDIGLNFPNPYASQCKQTKTHYILVHSAIEYFFRKMQAQ